jgi:heme exporter protein D
MDLGPHATFIWISYAAVALTIVALTVWLIADGRKQAHELAALGKLGIKRRSAAAEE